MTAYVHVRKMPASHLAALGAPSLILLLYETLRTLGGPTLGVERGEVWFSWAFSTFPLLLLIPALSRNVAAEGPDAAPGIERAEALLKETRIDLERQAAALAQLDAALGPKSRGRVGGVVFAIALTVLVLLGAFSIGYVVVGAQGAMVEPVHIHASFAVYVDGERLSFLDPSFDMSARGHLLGHLHMPNETLLHVEGLPGATLPTLFANAVGLELAEDHLRLDSTLRDGRDLKTDATHPLRVFVAESGSTRWKEVAVAHAPKDGERILVIYGAMDKATFESAAERIPVPSAS